MKLQVKKGLKARKLSNLWCSEFMGFIFDMEEKRCRRCRSEIEDDQHILSACIINNKLIQERHNRLVNKIGKELKNNLPDSTIQIERTWRRGTELVKLDITLIDKSRNHWAIVEVTWPYETSKEYLTQRKIEKERKYCALIPGELWQTKCESGEVIGIAIGAMGTILDDSYKAIKGLGLTNHYNALQMIAMNSSLILPNKHFSTSDFHKKNRHKRPNRNSKHWNNKSFQEQLD